MVFARKNCDFPWLSQFRGVSETSRLCEHPISETYSGSGNDLSVYICIYIYKWDSRPTRRNFPRKIPKKHPKMPVADFMLKSRFTSQLANFWSRPLEASIPSSTKKRHSGHIWPFLGERFCYLPDLYTYSPKRCVSRCSRTWGVFSSGWPVPWIDHLRCTSLRRPTARFTWWTTTPRLVALVHPHQTNGPCKNLKIWRRYNGPYWECLWYHEIGEDGEHQQGSWGKPAGGWWKPAGSWWKPAGSWLVSSFFATPFEVSTKKRSEVNQPSGWKEIMPEKILPNKNQVGWSGGGFYNLCIDMLWFSMLEIKVLIRQKGATSRFVSPKHCHPEAKVRNNDEKTPPEKNNRHRLFEKVHWKEHPNILFQNHTPRKLTTCPPRRWPS